MYAHKNECRPPEFKVSESAIQKDDGYGFLVLRRNFIARFLCKTCKYYYRKNTALHLKKYPIQEKFMGKQNRGVLRLHENAPVRTSHPHIGDKSVDRQNIFLVIR